MATSSITKKYIIKDDQTCDKLIKILAEAPPRKKVVSSKKYEEGKKLLAQYHQSIL